jgi:hypothetical protein
MGKRKVAVLSVLVVIALLSIVSSCKKEPGDGGLATIHGRVFGYNTNNFGIVTDSGYLAEARVYLAYGSHTWMDQDTRTSYTGEYAFPFLHTGDYSVWVINKCDTCPSHQSAHVIKVSISKPRETVEVPDLINIY